MERYTSLIFVTRSQQATQIEHFILVSPLPTYVQFFSANTATTIKLDIRGQHVERIICKSIYKDFWAFNVTLNIDSPILNVTHIIITVNISTCCIKLWHDFVKLLPYFNLLPLPLTFHK